MPSNPVGRLEEAAEVLSERVTVGDYLVDSLTAQSLDLPPQAAKVHFSVCVHCPALLLLFAMA